MIKFETGENCVGCLEVSGDLADVCTDLANLVNRIYNGCRRADVSEETAHEFQWMVMAAFGWSDSPVWKKREVDGAFLITSKEVQP